MTYRVLIAGLYHETHTFLDGRTRLADFRVSSGEEMLALCGDPSPLGGVLEFARQANWEPLPAIDMRALPGPLVDDAVLDRFWQHLQRTLATGGRLDGLFLVLHGAMVTESLDDVEGEILQRLWRSQGHGAVPTCAVLDLHANLTSSMARHVHGLIAYRENPHVDARRAATDAAALLDRLMRHGERAVTVCHRVPLMWPPTGTGTDRDPMRLLEAAARDIERRHASILAVNVLAGFAFADTPDTGVSFAATTVGDVGETEAALARLGELAMRHRTLGNCLEPPVAAVMADVRHRATGPIVIAEPSDNVGAGASGAGTGLLRVVLAHDIEGAVVVINDPAGVEALAGRAPGESAVISVGRQATALDPEPIVLEVTLVSRTGGTFVLEDPQSHLASMGGRRIDMGPCAVVRHRGVRILLTSRKTPPFDLGQLRSQGIEPKDAFLIGVKAAVAHRRAYDSIARAHYTIATPGPCASDLTTVPYRKVRRPIYPLDPSSFEDPRHWRTLPDATS